MKKRETLTRHHSVPSSRGGTDETIVLLPAKFHAAFHYLFQNLTPDEIHLFLEIILEPGTRWTRKDIHELMEEIKADTDSVDDEEVC